MTEPQQCYPFGLTLSLLIKAIFVINLFFFQILYNLLGEALSKLQQHDEAERWYKAALSAKPDHVPAHLTYGKLLAKNVSE